MKRTQHPLAAAFLALAIAPPAWAGPLEWAQLAAIIETLRKIHTTLQDINTFVRSTRDTLELVYPPAALREITQAFDQVDTIKDEVKELSCGWQFSASVQLLWDGLFSGQRLCKSEWQAVFGAPPPSVFQDLDEYQDYQAVRRMNMVASRVEAGPKSQEFLGWLMEEAEKGRDPGAEAKYGPGYFSAPERGRRRRPRKCPHRAGRHANGRAGACARADQREAPPAEARDRARARLARSPRGRLIMRTLAVLALVASLLVSPSASAMPIIGPDTAYLLRIVANLLRTIQQVQLEMQRGLQRRIDVLVSDVAFPSYPGESVFDPIHKVLGDVRGIRRELTELSCSWLFTSRTSLLRDRLLRPLRLCRPDFQLLWGNAERQWDADLHEAQDFAGSLTDNLVSTRVDAEETWTALFPRMEEAGALFRRSPGEANRDEAVLLAAAGHVAASNSSIQAQKLLVDSLDWQLDRHDEALERYAALGLLHAFGAE